MSTPREYFMMYTRSIVEKMLRFSTSIGIFSNSKVDEIGTFGGSERKNSQYLSNFLNNWEKQIKIRKNTGI